MQELSGRAEEFVQSLVIEDYGHAVGFFNDTMKGYMPALVVEKVWGQVVGTAGNYRKILKTETKLHQNLCLAFVTVECSLTNFTLRIVFTHDGQITGLSFEPQKETRTSAG